VKDYVLSSVTVNIYINIKGWFYLRAVRDLRKAQWRGVALDSYLYEEIYISTLATLNTSMLSCPPN
jgi:hypothetical protein